MYRGQIPTRAQGGTTRVWILINELPCSVGVSGFKYAD